MELAERIKHLRVASGLSQKKFGSLVGLSDCFISLLESGQRTGVGFAAARRIAEAYGTTASWVAFGEGRKPGKQRVFEAAGVASRRLKKTGGQTGLTEKPEAPEPPRAEDDATEGAA